MLDLKIKTNMYELRTSMQIYIFPWGQESTSPTRLERAHVLSSLNFRANSTPSGEEGHLWYVLHQEQRWLLKIVGGGWSLLEEGDL